MLVRADCRLCRCQRIGRPWLEQSVHQGWDINSRRTLSRGDHPQPIREFPKSPVASPFLPAMLQNPLDPAVIPDPRVLVIALATVTQLGRDSCRERVCTNVSNLVVAGATKNKN